MRVLKNKKSSAFTLAELLIALALIGVVAALLIPQVMTYISQMSWAKAKDNFESKVEEATKQMNIEGLLSGYSSNEAFANALKRYVKVAQQCSASDMSTCFVSTFKTSDGTEVNISSLSTGSDFGLSSNSSSLVGLQFADGINAIMAYNLSCEPPDWYNTSSARYSPTASGSDRSYTAGATTSCLSILYDVNGFQGPNVIDKDIRGWNVTLAICTGTKIGSLCIDESDTASAAVPSQAAYEALQSAGKITDFYGYSSTLYASDYWAGAIYACDQKSQRVPTLSELDIIYANRGSISGINALGIYWSSEEGGNQNGWFADFSAGGAHTSYFRTWEANVRCVK
ncbi:MAG: prepilin-type N-terminal cleavage/methylation domain-containing protein [Candidatus Gastranaerophilales bacterium]|nr:prepilin-type N-terminal cleavage/methylation domain-containing protein [Candidatus Gastranaerophilales bacterium]